MKTSITISEIFGPTIQGEGVLTGRLTVFVRTGGCDFRCLWCDTPHAVLPSFRKEWNELSAEAILDQVESLVPGPLLITLSGGNPALQPLGPLLDLGKQKGYHFALETQGTIAQEWFEQLDYLILSPKPPSSGMPMPTSSLSKCIEAAGENTAVTIKIVVFGMDDYNFAMDIHRTFPTLAFYLQPGNPVQLNATDNTQQTTVNVTDIATTTSWLIGQTVTDNWTDVTIMPQLHTLLWGNKRAI